MATTVTFLQTEGGSASITIRAPGYPHQPRSDYPGLVVGRTASGGFRVTNYGSGTPEQQPILYWSQLTDADYQYLKDWIEGDIVYQLYHFTYTDPFAAAHTKMRYLRGLETFRINTRNNYWSGQLYIAKDWDA